MMTKTESSARFLLQAGILSGTIIGAGIFALPYVFQAAGVLTGIFYLAIGSLVSIGLYRMYAEIIARTSGEHRLLGFARRYFGGAGFLAAMVSSIVQIIFVLTIYLVLSQSFAGLLFPSVAPLHQLVIFWLIGSAAIFLGFRRIAWLELLITGGIIAIIGIIFVFGLSRIGGFAGSFFPVNFEFFLLPLAPVLFSLAGRQAIPEVVKFGGNVRRAITAGVFVPALVYILFVAGVLSLSGTVTPDAVTSLLGRVPAAVLTGIGIAGIFSLISSYITIGFDVYKSLEVDAKLPRWLNMLIVVFGPIFLYLAGFSNFLELVSFTGGLLLALEAVFIMAIWRRAAEKKWNLGHWLMFLVFATAFLYEIIRA